MSRVAVENCSLDLKPWFEPEGHSESMTFSHPDILRWDCEVTRGWQAFLFMSSELTHAHMIFSDRHVYSLMTAYSICNDEKANKNSSGLTQASEAALANSREEAKRDDERIGAFGVGIWWLWHITVPCRREGLQEDLQRCPPKLFSCLSRNVTSSCWHMCQLYSSSTVCIPKTHIQALHESNHAQRMQRLLIWMSYLDILSTPLPSGLNLWCVTSLLHRWFAMAMLLDSYKSRNTCTCVYKYPLYVVDVDLSVETVRWIVSDTFQISCIVRSGRTIVCSIDRTASC